MREPLKDRNRLEHMLERIDFVLDAVKGYTYEQFCNDKIRFAAVSYGTLVIGEAAYMLSKEFKESHPATPWRQIEGMPPHCSRIFSSQARYDLERDAKRFAAAAPAG